MLYPSVNKQHNWLPSPEGMDKHPPLAIVRPTVRKAIKIIISRFSIIIIIITSSSSILYRFIYCPIQKGSDDVWMHKEQNGEN